ncbi:Os05g0510750 [Oryza sativa Japonica Group]|uniref:Os05g0510750 protein n=1 Tax=Oryza sativa subsp. japonica TaxID=39947 RepID=A0A0P0WPG7_ORYSJ|nr:Os05g0510750 [Oryza sativa Japonica Group]
MRVPRCGSHGLHLTLPPPRQARQMLRCSPPSRCACVRGAADARISPVIRLVLCCSTGLAAVCDRDYVALRGRAVCQSVGAVGWLRDRLYYPATARQLQRLQPHAAAAIT